MRDGRLEAIEAVVQRQVRVSFAGNDHRLLCLAGTVDFGSDGPAFMSSTVTRLRQFATFFGLMPSSRLDCKSAE